MTEGKKKGMVTGREGSKEKKNKGNLYESKEAGKRRGKIN